MQTSWIDSGLPDLTNRHVVVTGAGRQPGRMIVQRLSDLGAIVFAVSRDELPAGSFNRNVEPVRMNPTSMESIHRGAEHIRDQVNHLDVLIHAASISIAPHFRTREGHNLMVATNYFGFVVLAHELASAMRASIAPRVVLAGSGQPLAVDMDLDHLDGESDSDWHVAHARSRLAALMFAIELNSRASAVRSPLISAIAEAREPDTLLDAHHPLRRQFRGFVSRIAGVPEDAPIRPVLYASTSGDIRGGEYYDARDRARRRVEPNPSKIPSSARNPALRSELWERTEDMLGLRLEVA